VVFKAASEPRKIPHPKLSVYEIFVVVVTAQLDRILAPFRVKGRGRAMSTTPQGYSSFRNAAQRFFGDKPLPDEFLLWTQK
jgi:hypothetical protein